MNWQLLRVIRGHIVLGGALAFTVGALLGVVNGGVFNAHQIAVCYIVVFFGDLSTHFGNDYFDYDEDRAYGFKRRFFHGSQTLVKNPTLLPYAKKAALALLAVSVLVAVSAVILQIVPIELLLIALSANFLGWFYSAPPIRLVSRRLGEAAIALSVGFAIPAVGYLAVRGQLDWFFGLFAVPFVLYGLMLALSLEGPDVEVDRLGTKKTFGVCQGTNAVYSLIFGVASAALAIFLLCAWQFPNAPINFLAASAIAALPVAAGIAGIVVLRKKISAEVFSATNILSLFLVNLLMAIYLLVVALKVV